MMEVQTLKNLVTWQKARDLRILISKTVQQFPKEEKYRLVDQIIRSSRSILANIAEGYGRFYYQENIQYCRQARGSLIETLDHIICAFDEGYISENELSLLEKEIENCRRTLNGYIAYLKKAKLSA